MVTDEEAAVGPPHRHHGTMRDVLCMLLSAAAALFSVFFFIKENPFDTTSFLSLVSTRSCGSGKVEVPGLRKRRHYLSVRLCATVTNIVDTQRRKIIKPEDSTYFSLMGK